MSPIPGNESLATRLEAILHAALNLDPQDPLDRMIRDNFERYVE